MLLLPVACPPARPQKAKMKDMGEQLEDMSSELGKLRVENNSLKNRNTILEKVLALRDEHIRMLQDEQQVGRVGGWAVGWAGGWVDAQTCWQLIPAEWAVGWLKFEVLALGGEVGGAAPQRPPHWACANSNNTARASSNNTAQQLFGRITAVCLRWLRCLLSPPPPVQVFDLGNHYLQSSGSQKMLTGGASMSAAGALALGTTSGPLTTSEIKAVKGMPAEVVIGRWKETVRELGNILVQVGGVGGC